MCNDFLARASKIGVESLLGQKKTVSDCNRWKILIKTKSMICCRIAAAMQTIRSSIGARAHVEWLSLCVGTRMHAFDLNLIFLFIYFTKFCVIVGDMPKKIHMNRFQCNTNIGQNILFSLLR